MKLNVEPITNKFLRELPDLLFAYYAEMGILKSFQAPNPDLPTFVQAQEKGIFRLHTLRTNDEKLVGFSGWVLIRDQHEADKMVATQDCIYVAKQYRGVSAGRFLNFISVDLTALVQEIQWSAQPDSTFDKLLKKYMKPVLVTYKQVTRTDPTILQTRAGLRDRESAGVR